MRGEILMAQAKYSDRAGLHEARLSFAREAVVELTAGERLGDKTCGKLLQTARAYAGEYADLTLEYLQRATANPLDWRGIGDLAATIPEKLSKEQTSAIREYLLELRRALAPHLRDR